MTTTSDFLVIGGGEIGLSVAREIKRRHRGARVLVIDKEPRLGAHASGRNSGVLHAGFYHTPIRSRRERFGDLLGLRRIGEDDGQFTEHR
jgi:L-2-hydroxyglutarate oxidase LhgO